MRTLLSSALFLSLAAAAAPAQEPEREPQPPPPQEQQQGQEQQQEQQPAPAQEKPEPEKQDFLSESLATMKALHQSIEGKQEELEEAQNKLRREIDPQLRADLTANARAIEAELTKLQRNLTSIVTGIDLDAFEAAPEAEFRLARELEELLRPLIEELKSATEDPRQISQLKADEAEQEKRRKLAVRAIESIDRLLARARQDGDDQVVTMLEGYQQTWVRNRDDAANQAAVARHQLEQRQRDRESLFEGIQRLLSGFLSSRGFNFLLALLAFAGVFVGLRFASRPLLALAKRKRKKQEELFYLRLLRVAYHFAILVIALLAALMVLYATDDWVLLGLVLLFLVGLAWAGKNTLPRVVEQLRLLLNLGAVRERERVVFAGLPWRVESLNIYSYLTNSALSGGRIRLPLRDLVGLHSRPCLDKELWFPCQEGDWVVTSDGTRGKVLSQTPEMVQLIQLGGSKVTYRTSTFLDLNPKNLSSNFRLQVTFGVDYQHQAICTTEIPTIMQQRLRDDLNEAVGEDNVIHLAVEFKLAGSSSLDYEVIADLSGSVAARSQSLERRIQRVLVDACNENGWVIPFTQITLHQAD